MTVTELYCESFDGDLRRERCRSCGEEMTEFELEQQWCECVACQVG